MTALTDSDEPNGVVRHIVTVDGQEVVVAEQQVLVGGFGEFSTDLVMENGDALEVTYTITLQCPVHLVPEPCRTCSAYIAAGL